MSTKRSRVTLVVTNLHCSSCVDKITTLLSSFEASLPDNVDKPPNCADPSVPMITDVSVSLLSHTVSFMLTPPRRASTKGNLFTRATTNEIHRAGRQILSGIVQRLTEIGGFDIEDPVDPYHRVPIVTAFDVENGAASRLRKISKVNRTPPSWLSRLFSGNHGPNDQVHFARHLESCLACQNDVALQDFTASLVNDAYINEAGNIDSPAFGVVEAREALFAVEGMTCAACTTSLGESFKPSVNPGIVAFDINLLAASARVKYLPHILSPHTIRDLIDDAGFGAELIDDQPIISKEVLPWTPENATATTPEGNQVTRTTMSIHGMTCASCSTSIAKALKQTDKILNVNIDILSASGVVEHLTSLEIDSIKGIIEDAGFVAEVSDSFAVSSTIQDGNHSGKLDKGRSIPASRTVQIHVDGIYCLDCVRKLNAKLESIAPSIISFSPFTLQKNSCTITYRPKDPYNLRDLLLVLENVSTEFTASLVKPKSIADRGKEIQKRERTILCWHFLAALAAAIPTFVIGIVAMLLLRRDHSFRRFVDTMVWGSADRGTVALWILATLVQFGVGRLFYERTWRSIKPAIRNLLTRRHKAGGLSWEAFFRFGSMDLLVVLSTTTAYFASLAMMILDITDGNPVEMQTMAQRRGTFFDSSVFLIMFILGGRALEALAKAKTTSAISLLGSLRPATALLIDNDIGPELFNQYHVASSFMNDISTEAPFSNAVRGVRPVEIPVDLLDYGDVVLVRPGDLPPTDGIVVDGTTAFDESSLTGESRPVQKGPTDPILTGTINLTSPIKVRVTALGQETMVESIIRAVSDASAKKAPVEKLAEAITGVFVPVVIYLALAVMLIWLSLTLAGVVPEAYLPNGRTGTSDKLFFAFQFSIAVLVVACPCGIGLAAPCAQAVGTGVAANAGVLAAGGGEAFQGANLLTHVVFDKTGTLTNGGELQVIDISTDEEVLLQVNYLIDKSILAQIISTIEATSTHPVATALIRSSERAQTDNEGSMQTVITILTSEEIAGMGVQAKIRLSQPRVEPTDLDVLIGNERLMSAHSCVALSVNRQRELKLWKSQAKSIVLVAFRSNKTRDLYHVAARYSIADSLRPESKSVVNHLQQQGYQVHLLSGDNTETALAIGAQVGIEPEKITAEVLPEQKGHHIQQLQRQTVLKTRVAWFPAWSFFQYKTRAVVMFVGDGLNDSVALSAADVAVALSHGAQASIASADFVLLKSDLNALVQVLRISKKVYRRQKLNFAWALVFNVVLIPVAAGAFYASHKIRLPPVWAALAMALSSSSVIFSSLALKYGI